MPDLEEAVEQTPLSKLTDEVFGEEIDEVEEVEAEESAEESVEEEAEATDDETQQETVEAQATEPPVVAPPSDDKWDKALQQSQQLNASYERLLEKYANNPTPANQQAVEKTKSKLDLILEANSEDVDPYEAAKTVAGEVKALQADREARSASDQDTIASLTKQIAANNDRQARIEFRQDNPGIADKYDDLVGKLTEEMKPLAQTGAGAIPEDTWNYMVNQKWSQLVEGAKADDAKAETKTADSVPAPVKTPVATNPVKQKKGTRSKPATDRKARLSDLRDTAFGDD